VTHPTQPHPRPPHPSHPTDTTFRCAGTASFIFAAANASDHYEITTPVVGQTYAKDVFWITLSRISPRTASWRVVLWEEQLASVDSVPGVWHTTSVEVEAGDTPTVRVHVDGQPMQPLRHGMLLKDGSTLDLEAVGRGGRIGSPPSRTSGSRRKAPSGTPASRRRNLRHLRRGGRRTRTHPRKRMAYCPSARTYVECHRL
jgi:hypothetical protein